MKKLILIAIFILSVTYTFAQPAKIEKGKKYFQLFDYSNTIEQLEPLKDKTDEINRYLAISYYNTGQYDKAEQYYAVLANSENKTIDDIFGYIKILLINKKYEQAEPWINTFNEITENDIRAKLFASNSEFYKEISKDKGFFIIKNLNFNNDAQEFAPAFYKDKIVFASTRQGIEPIKRKYSWNNMPFLNLYIADADTANLELSELKSFNFNKKFHEGTVSFSKDGKFVVYTSDNYKQKGSDGSYNLEMFSSEFVDDKWTKPKPLPFNNPDYSVGHPSLSPDGKVLFFVSDMPKGIGGTDIYVSTKNNDGTWSAPANLGNEINTEGNEMFPFYSDKGYLFFSSDGRPGLGGLDIFVAKINNGKYEDIQNMGAPLNSNFDDFALILKEDLTNGYFSSNRPGGKGDDDIYSVRMIPFFQEKYLEGIVVNEQDSILGNVTVKLYNNEGIELGTVVTSENGQFRFKVKNDSVYALSGNKEEYTEDHRNVEIYGDSLIYHTKLILKQKPEFGLKIIVLDDKTNLPLDKVGINLKDITFDKTSNFVTDTSGSVSVTLDSVQQGIIYGFNFNMKKEKYLPLTTDTIAYFKEPGELVFVFKLHQLNIGENIAKVVGVKNIYFDLNKFNIRPDAALELDKIMKVMNEYPTLEIELGSHTDSRGSDSYNLSLSDKRAKASADYIKARITNPERISGKGYGETTPFVVTQKIHEIYVFLPVGQILDDKFIYSLPKKQQEIAHQFNRRTEFKIIKF